MNSPDNLDDCTIFPCRVYKPTKSGLKLTKEWSRRKLLKRDWSNNVIGDGKPHKWQANPAVTKEYRIQKAANAALADLEDERLQRESST